MNGNLSTGPVPVVESGSSPFAASLASKGLFGGVVLLVAAATAFQLFTAGQTGLPDEFLSQAEQGNSAATIPDSDFDPNGSPGDDLDEPGAVVPARESPPTLPDLTPERPASFADKSVAQGSLFSSDDAESALATVMIMGDIMVTSASAIDSYSELWLEGTTAREPFPVRILGHDRFADIAVLATPDAANVVDGEPGLLLEELVALPRFDPEQVEQVIVGDGRRVPSKDGAVISVDEAISHYSGHTIYSAIVTSIPFEDHLAGAPLTTPAGDLVGLVVNAAGAVVAALPVDDVIRLAQSLLSLDGSDESFAVDLDSDADGRSTVIGVDPTGPFANDLIDGDVVVAVDGISIMNPDHLTHVMRRVEPGSSVVLTVERANVQFKTSALQVDNPHLAVNPISQP